MTRCSGASKRSARNPNTSFFYKILSSLKQLQSTSKFCNGASVDDIAKFMEAKYDLSGDVYSQIENSLCIAEESRFVLRKRHCYSLVSPAATLQLIPAPCVKAKLERIQKVFNSRWCEKEDKCKPQCQAVCQPPPRCPRPRRPCSSDSCESLPKPECKPRTRSRCQPMPKPKCKPRTRARCQPMPKSKCKPRARSRCKPLPKPMFKPRTKAKCKPRTKPRTRRKAACQPRSQSVCGYRTRSRTKRRAKVLPMCTTSFSNCCRKTRYSVKDSDSSSY